MSEEMAQLLKALKAQTSNRLRDLQRKGAIYAMQVVVALKNTCDASVTDWWPSEGKEAQKPADGE